MAHIPQNRIIFKSTDLVHNHAATDMASKDPMIYQLTMDVLEAVLILYSTSVFPIPTNRRLIAISKDTGKVPYDGQTNEEG
jgi:hypothetical protein